MTATIAIVGRPNVGKSTLFNRLVGRRTALVSNMPGLTRDRRDGEAVLIDKSVRFVDTAGLEDAAGGSIAARMRAQSELAVAEADAVIFLFDARAGLTPIDREFAVLVRQSGKPVIVVANKCEGHAGEPGFLDAYELGLGEPLAISAEHGTGVSDLKARLADALRDVEDAPADEDDDEQDRSLRLAIVGRPNAGKSTLVNALLGDERMITGPEAGLTRDSVASDMSWKGRAICVYDTAGLRRKARVSGDAEKLSVGDALRAIRFAEVVVLVVDAEHGLEHQDLTIADLVLREGRALVVAVNKWDIAPDKQALMKELRSVLEGLAGISGLPMIMISALSGQRLDKLMDAVLTIYDVWNKRVPTAALNRWLQEAVQRHTLPVVRGRRLRLRFLTQPNARPPTFVAFCSRPEGLPKAYERYLINGLRDTFDMAGVPIRFHLRQGHNPYDPKR